MSRKLTFDIFLKRSIEKHGHFYDYSKVRFSTVCDKIEIICPYHGFLVYYFIREMAIEDDDYLMLKLQLDKVEIID